MTHEDQLSVAVELTHLSATSNANAQRKHEAELLAALNQIHRDFENGVRTTAAISQVTIEELDSDNDEAWNDITAEIASLDVNADLVTANRRFIKN